MVILHIASLTKDMCNGVNAVVPKYIENEKEYAVVGFININNVKIDSIKGQITFKNPFDINNLPKPFNKPDLVVFNEAYRIEYINIYKNLLKNKIKYIIIPHGELAKEAQRKKFIKKKFANILLFNRFIKKAQAIQCLSQRELESTKFKNIKFIGTNGVDIPKKQKENFNKKKTDFLYIGRLDAYHKGLDLFIQAVSSIKKFLKNNNCTFNIYGPDCAGRLQRLKELQEEYNVKDLVFLNGPLNGKEKEDRLIKSDIFIQTSRFEGMPLGVLEAMSYKLPVLITEGTNLKPFVKKYDGGWVADTSVKSIANKIKQAVNEKEKWQRKSKNAYTCAFNEFSWKKIAKSTIEKYIKIIGEK